MMLTKKSSLFILICTLFLAFVTGSNSLIPVTAGPFTSNPTGGFPGPLPSLNDFVSQVTSNPTGMISGVYVPTVLADQIRQQPSNNPGYISTQADVITQFGMASKYNTIGLLAHNTAAGESFQNMAVGQVVYLVKSNGDLKAYQISEIQRYQALSPTSPYSNFKNLDIPDATITAQTLFQRTYGRGGGMVIFQTCIEKDGEFSWGRLFVIATPLDNVPQVPESFRMIKFSHYRGVALAI